MEDTILNRWKKYFLLHDDCVVRSFLNDWKRRGLQSPNTEALIHFAKGLMWHRATEGLSVSGVPYEYDITNYRNVVLPAY